jgi:hypothetical protein
MYRTFFPGLSNIEATSNINMDFKIENEARESDTVIFLLNKKANFVFSPPIVMSLVLKREIHIYLLILSLNQPDSDGHSFSIYCRPIYPRDTRLISITSLMRCYVFVLQFNML